MNNDHALSYKIFPWFILYSDANDIVKIIQKEWIRLLSNSNNIEEKYQKYIHEHAGFFLADRWKKNVIISKLRLGANCIPDFVIGIDARSKGFRYCLIEIKTPHTPPYIKKGDPSADLTHAMQQIRDWKAWLEKNTQEAQRIFPSDKFSLQNFEYLIYIGNRKNSEEFVEDRNRLAEENNIEIRSFDSLTDNLLKGNFDTFLTMSSSESESLPIEINNQLANPFCKAYTDKNWRKIVNSHKFCDFHIISKNAHILLKNRDYNPLLAKFQKIWRNLSLERKKEILSLTKDFL